MGAVRAAPAVGAAILAAAAPPEGGVLLFVALFLLGYGWNMGYVAGSALLSSGALMSRQQAMYSGRCS